MRFSFLPLAAAAAWAACTPGGLSSQPGGSGASSGAAHGGSVTGSNGGGTSGSSTGESGTSAGGASTGAEPSTAGTAGGSSGGTAPGTSGGNTGGSSTGNGCTAQSASCCGASWAALDPTCAGFAISGAPEGTLYGLTSSQGSYQVVTLQPADGGVAVGSSGLGLGQAVAALALVPDAGSPTFSVLTSDQGGLALESAGGTTPLPTFTPAQGDVLLGITLVPGALVVTGEEQSYALPFPPGASWGPSPWPDGGTLPPWIFLSQAEPLDDEGRWVLAASYSEGAVIFSAATGAPCFTQGCPTRSNGQAPPLGVNLTGAAIDRAGGNLWLAGDGAENSTLEELDSSFACVGLWVGTSNECAEATGTSCPCTVDATLDGQGLASAAWFQGRLWATTSEVAQTPLALVTWTPDGGLAFVDPGSDWYALLVGP